MGVNMENKMKIYNRIIIVIAFILIPIMFYAFGNFPRRSVLKEIISVITLLSFFVILLQFYLTRANKTVLKNHKMSHVIKWHKVLGYVFVSILMVHPFLIVLPRYFEAGITPNDAFLELLNNFDNSSLLLGLIAWIVMLIIGLTSMFRSRLGINYKTWRIFHGIISLVFIVIASIHVINLGRHISLAMALLIISLASGAIVILLKTYFLKGSKNLK